ncbi:uncharacterized protein LOC115164718 isoform X1 [Salmo trutta]|uniref:uncharacterized protein LOC115164718 isoform X1 n=1 Tax=Salmo trutta TaxID=8032 RepID=UPI00113021D1|nr:uncharacterized protein LOC115164718 isoform X1 [Salmo trutta]
MSVLYDEFRVLYDEFLVFHCNRSGTVNVDKWSQSELSEWDINRIRSGGGRIFSLGPIFDGTSAPSCPGPKPPMRIRNSRMSKPFRIPSAASRSANVSRVTTARTQRLHDFKTDTLQDSQSQLRADTSLKSIDLGQHRKSVHVRNGGLKPLKPVGAQRPSIFQCTGITPDPTKNVREKYHQGDNTAPVFKRFYEVMLEEPQRRRQDRQRSAHTSGTFGGHMDDEHLETATSGYCLEVPSCSPNTLQLQLEGLCLQGEWGQLGGDKRCSSLPTSHPVKETFFKSMVSNDSHKDAGCASGRKIEDTSKEDSSKDTADPFFINKWDPGQLKVTFTLKDSNEQMIKSGLQKPSSS